MCCTSVYSYTICELTNIHIALHYSWYLNYTLFAVFGLFEVMTSDVGEIELNVLITCGIRIINIINSINKIMQ